MAKRISLTADQIVAEIERAARVKDPADAKTADELRRATGLSRDRISKYLHLLKDAGRLQVHRVKREALDGSLKWYPAYTVKRQ